MKIVLDTNVLMSAIFWKGTPRKLLDAWLDGGIALIISPEIVAEYERVAALLAERYSASAQAATQVVQLIVTRSEMVDAPALTEAVCTDPDDDKFIACALVSSADCIVTGDKALRVGGERVGVTTLSPRQLVDRLSR